MYSIKIVTLYNNNELFSTTDIEITFWGAHHKNGNHLSQNGFDLYFDLYSLLYTYFSFRLSNIMIFLYIFTFLFLRLQNL